MIRVTYWPEDLRILVEGHAGYAPVGEDLVCSAASILVHTLSVTLRRLELCGRVELKTRILPGDSEIRCEVLDPADSEPEMAFRFAETGFAILAENLPEFIFLNTVLPG